VAENSNTHFIQLIPALTTAYYFLSPSERRTSTRQLTTRCRPTIFGRHLFAAPWIVPS